MKKILLLLCVAASFTSCKKAILERTTVKIVADDAVVNVDFTNDDEKYLSNMSDDQIREMYLQAFEDELGRGKIDLTDNNPDYVIEIKQINIQEWVESVYEEDRWISLSKIDMEAKYVMIESAVDIPSTFYVDMTVQESIAEDKKDHSKKNWGHDKTSSEVEINGFGGLEGALDYHSTQARSDIKGRFKDNQ